MASQNLIHAKNNFLSREGSRALVHPELGAVDFAPERRSEADSQKGPALLKILPGDISRPRWTVRNLSGEVKYAAG